MLWKNTNRTNFKVKSSTTTLFYFYYNGDSPYSKGDFTGNTAYSLMFHGDESMFSRKMDAYKWNKVHLLFDYLYL